MGIRRQASFDRKAAMKMRADENYEHFQTRETLFVILRALSGTLKLLKELAAVDVNHATKAH